MLGGGGAAIVLIASLLHPAPRHTHTSEPVPQVRHAGYATWYAASGMIAAAGPALRRELGKGWRGERVRVTAGGRSVVVRLTDWCACGPRHGRPTLLDLSDDAFRRLAPLSRGVQRVVVGW
jgi:Lytic transglycolase